jgi:peptidoglycan biosynthesis protein MviN/MurJ (putative lipid II flippase)
MVQRRDIMNLMAVNVLIAASGIIATMQIAWLFGANRNMDVWFLAASLTSGIFGLTQSGQLSELFLPEYIRIKHQFGQQKAFECYCVVFNWAVFATVVITTITFISSKVIIDYAASGFATDQKITVLEIFKFLLPLVPLQIIGAVQQMMGNAEKKFGKFELGALLGSVLSIISVFILHKSMGLWALVSSQWILQLTILIYRHIQLRKAQLTHRWIWKTENFDIFEIIKQLGQTTLYVFSTQIYSITFKSLLGALPSGILSAYSYAETLYLRTSSLFITPVGKVFFTSVATSFAVEPLKVLANIKYNRLNYFLMQH